MDRKVHKIRFEEEIIVRTDPKYSVLKKPFPEGMDESVVWLCNFLVYEPPNTIHHPTLPGEEDYDILVPWSTKTLVYWDGKAKQEFPRQDLEEEINGKRYKKVTLNLTDPPVGYD